MITRGRKAGSAALVFSAMNNDVPKYDLERQFSFYCRDASILSENSSRTLRPEFPPSALRHDDVMFKTFSQTWRRTLQVRHFGHGAVAEGVEWSFVSSPSPT